MIINDIHGWGSVPISVFLKNNMYTPCRLVFNDHQSFQSIQILIQGWTCDITAVILFNILNDSGFGYHRCRIPCYWPENISHFDRVTFNARYTAQIAFENVYWQYFCGETYFQYDKPFDPSEFVHFRKRLGTDGAEKLLRLSISLFEKKEVEEKEVLIDTTVQEKNITYPTDAKLHKKIIEGCWKIAEKEDIDLRQSYSRTLGQLMIDQRFREHPKRKRKAIAAARKIKTIAGRLVRDVERGLDDKERLEAYDEQLWLYYRVCFLHFKTIPLFHFKSIPLSMQG